jgi:DNA-directed RNA polymerase specialized sigma subunit
MVMEAGLAADLARASEQVRKSAAVLELRTMERDDLVIRAREAGTSLREIAEIAGLTHATIARIERRVNAEIAAEMAADS